MEKTTLDFKRYFWLIFIFLLTFTTQSKAQETNNKKLIEFAETFYQNMLNRKYESLHATFDQNLKQEIPLEDLKKHIEDFFKNYGKVIKKDPVILRSMEGYTVTIVPLHFNEKNFELRLALNKENKVSGLFFTEFDTSKKIK